MSAALIVVPLVAIDGGWTELSSTLTTKKP